MDGLDGRLRRSPLPVTGLAYPGRRGRGARRLEGLCVCARWSLTPGAGSTTSPSWRNPCVHMSGITSLSIPGGILIRTTLQGYLLEEALAWLLRNSGYRLLNSVKDDPDELTTARDGSLRVRGRGSHHQVDVLGEFTFTPAFSLPVRMFLESKFTTGKIGLATVRNAHGVIHDVNQNFTLTIPTRRRSATDPIHRGARGADSSTSTRSSRPADSPPTHSATLWPIRSPSWTFLAPPSTGCARPYAMSLKRSPVHRGLPSSASLTSAPCYACIYRQQTGLAANTDSRMTSRQC